MAELEPTTDASGRRAQFRLRDMLTTAVGLVDRPANNEMFLVVKSREGMAEKADEGQDGLRLPADAKQSLTDGIADVLEKLSVIAQQIAGGIVDEEAECPPELSAAVDELADDLDELAEEFAPKATPTEMKAKGALRKARKDALMKAKAKAKPFPGAAPPFGKDEADLDAGDVAKGPPEAAFSAGGSAPPAGSPPGEGAGPEVPRDPPGEGPGAAGAPQPRGTAENPEVVMKAGRKMARERLEALQKGHALQKAAFDLHEQAMKSHQDGMGHLEQATKGGGADAVYKAHAVHKAAGALHEEAHKMHGEGVAHVERVLKEVGADGPPGFMQPPGAAREPPPSAKPAPAEPAVAPRAAAPDTTGLSKADVTAATKAAVDEALRGPLAELSDTKKSLDEVRKELGDANRLAELRSLTGTPRALPSGEQPRPPSAKANHSWPADMSADLKQRAAKK